MNSLIKLIIILSCISLSLYCLLNKIKILNKYSIKQRVFNVNVNNINDVINQEKMWLPIVNLKDLSMTSLQPIAIDILDESYILWQNHKQLKNRTKGWNLMKNICAHRFAPLSEGTINRENGCLECPNHGWQYDNNGKCTFIPQLDATQRQNVISTPSVDSYQLHITGNLLWAHISTPFKPYDFIKPFTLTTPFTATKKLPEKYFPELLNDKNDFTMCELPYSFDMLIEKLMDPVHEFYQTYSKKGDRNDRKLTPIPMQIITSIENTTHCEISFHYGSTEGILSFITSCYFSLRIKDPHTHQYVTQRIGLAVPSTIGNCRLFYCDKLHRKDKFLVLFPSFTLFLRHQRFMDTIEKDLWLKHQEYNMNLFTDVFNEYASSNNNNNNNMNHSSNNNVSEGKLNIEKYFEMIVTPPQFYPTEPLDSYQQLVPSTSTSTTQVQHSLLTQTFLSSIAWRLWWKKHMGFLYNFGSSILTETSLTQYNRYHSHTKHCKHCKHILRIGTILKFMAPLIGLFAVAYWPVMFSLSVYFILDQSGNWFINNTKGMTKHSEE